ncbi:MAG: 30S ribosomal protein S13 [Candidatus Dojkabacteria bacterium]|nr:MAG: 30S ribosomal protein S13 [Candidatus Dojkabacteria bacterium]
MARVSGVEIPDNKKLKIALTYIYGIGQTTAEQIVDELNLDGDVRLKELSESDITKLRTHIDANYEVEGELKQKVFRNVKRLKDTRSYRGIRHKLGLPVRGQRTRVNARTRKGRALPVGGLKIKVSKT